MNLRKELSALQKCNDELVQENITLDEEGYYNLILNHNSEYWLTEETLKEVISELSSMTGKEVSKQQEEKIINTIINDNVPQNIDKMF